MRIYILPIILALVNCSPGSKKTIDFSKMQASEPKKVDNLDMAYALVDADSLQIIDSYNENGPLIPASTTKILTIAAALKILGVNHRFKTKLSYSGTIEGNTLKGNLYLIGGGDPTLKIRDLITFVEQLAALKIKKITGDFIVDDSYLYFHERIDDGMSIDAHYNQALSALTVNYNLALTRWQYDWRKRSYKYIITPPLDSIKINVSGERFLEPRKFKYALKDNTEHWRHAQDYRRHARSHSKLLPTRRPSLYAGEFLKYIAQQSQITLPEPKKGEVSDSHKEIYVKESQDLLFIGEAVLDYSSNLIADTILLHIGKHLRQKKTSLKDSAKALTAYLQSQIHGIDFKGFNLVNGSGLTAENRISPLQMIAILKWASFSKYRKKSFQSLLPISGAKGSLTNRLYSNEHAYRVFAKTGAIAYAVALAGFFKGIHGKEYIFAQFYRQQSRRDFINVYNNAASAKLRQEAPRWGVINRAKIDSRLKHWLNSDLPELFLAKSAPKPSNQSENK